MPSPLHVQNRQAAELPGREASPAAAAGANYYEDVDPRFANPSPAHHISPHNAPPLQNQQSLSPAHPIEPMYEDARATTGGHRSPAESDRSNFTSISQRGVNPRWNQPPPMPQQQYGAPPRRPVQQQRQDMILDNADFQLPGASGRSPKRGAAGLIPGSAYPTGGYQ